MGGVENRTALLAASHDALYIKWAWELFSHWPYYLLDKLEMLVRCIGAFIHVGVQRDILIKLPIHTCVWLNVCSFSYAAEFNAFVTTLRNEIDPHIRWYNRSSSSIQCRIRHFFLRCSPKKGICFLSFFLSVHSSAYDCSDLRTQSHSSSKWTTPGNLFSKKVGVFSMWQLMKYDAC